ncbi:MAG TPA: DNA repair protein RecN [Steroidobacteraceae bacterium]|nr:DNA repair protein RecN [Steroidobacteraceae bacterium]
MLVHLQIRDLAVIDAAEIELDGGLTALTGETGAGKSIIVDAVMLALGGRASADTLRHGAERAEITATFDVAANAPARRWLDEQSISADGGELVLRRVIGRDGRSRQYVNGQALPAQSVRELGERLIDIHGPQEFLALVKRDAQREIVDAHGVAGALLADVSALALEWRRCRDERDSLAALARDRGARLELLRYQVGELDALSLAPGEAAELAAERQRLANRGRLAEAAQGALALCYEGDGDDAHALAARAASLLRPAAGLDTRLAAALSQVEESLIALREAGAGLGAYLEGLDADPARQELVERRVAAIEELARKHRVESSALPAKLGELQRQLTDLEQSESTLGGLDERLSELRRRYAAAATALGTARRAGARKLAGAVTALMRQLGMPGGRFEVGVDSDAGADPAPEGAERIEFLVSANPGEPVKPVGRVASGGELSRISLAVQVAAARRTSRTCLIFDEVDAGIGGGVAEIVGRKLRELGDRGQVLCVTHLAQVASQAHHQHRVSKITDGRSSRTTVTALDDGERVEELARMIGGVEVTRKAREHAREMLKSTERAG